MLSKPDGPAAVPPPSPRDRLLVEEFHLKDHARKVAWWSDMEDKLRLQRQALRELPPALRAAAEQPDLAHPPPNRKFMMDSPPEAYRDL